VRVPPLSQTASAGTSMRFTQSSPWFAQYSVRPTIRTSRWRRRGATSVRGSHRRRRRRSLDDRDAREHRRGPEVVSCRQRARAVVRLLELGLREEVFRDDAVDLRFGERLVLVVEPFATWRTRDMRSSGNSEARSSPRLPRPWPARRRSCSWRARKAPPPMPEGPPSGSASSRLADSVPARHRPCRRPAPHSRSPAP
jgi:hypothetical protein